MRHWVDLHKMQRMPKQYYIEGREPTAGRGQGGREGWGISMLMKILHPSRLGKQECTTAQAEATPKTPN